MTVLLANTPMIETQRLTLRAPRPQDAESYIDFFASERANSIGGVRSRSDAWRDYISELGHWVQRGYGMFIVTRKGEDTALGLIGPWNPDDWPEPEIGWIIFDPAVEGTGVAFEAARACVEFAWTKLRWTSVVSYIGATNTRSIALAKRLGAVLDPAAKTPGDWATVYRHPAPEGMA